MEAVNDRFASFTTHFSPAIHAGQAVIQSESVTTGMPPIAIAKFSNDVDIDTFLNTFERAVIQNQCNKSTATSPPKLLRYSHQTKSAAMMRSKG
jgi:hypothetical protein